MARSKGAKVRGFALDPSTEPNLFNIASVGHVLDDDRAHIRD
jgi:CDP-glucose 4,6-dehydratase